VTPARWRVSEDAEGLRVEVDLPASWLAGHVQPPSRLPRVVRLLCAHLLVAAVVLVFRGEIGLAAAVAAGLPVITIIAARLRRRACTRRLVVGGDGASIEDIVHGRPSRPVLLEPESLSRLRTAPFMSRRGAHVVWLDHFHGSVPLAEGMSGDSARELVEEIVRLRPELAGPPRPTRLPGRQGDLRQGPDWKLSRADHRLDARIAPVPVQTLWAMILANLVIVMSFSDPFWVWAVAVSACLGVLVLMAGFRGRLRLDDAGAEYREEWWGIPLAATRRVALEDAHALRIESKGSSFAGSRLVLDHAHGLLRTVSLTTDTAHRLAEALRAEAPVAWATRIELALPDEARDGAGARQGVS